MRPFCPHGWKGLSCFRPRAIIVSANNATVNDQNPIGSTRCLQKPGNFKIHWWCEQLKLCLAGASIWLQSVGRIVIAISTSVSRHRDGAWFWRCSTLCHKVTLKQKLLKKCRMNPALFQQCGKTQTAICCETVCPESEDRSLRNSSRCE